jgi:hypothetical protein
MPLPWQTEPAAKAHCVPDSAGSTCLDRPPQVRPRNGHRARPAFAAGLAEDLTTGFARDAPAPFRPRADAAGPTVDWPVALRETDAAPFATTLADGDTRAAVPFLADALAFSVALASGFALDGLLGLACATASACAVSVRATPRCHFGGGLDRLAGPTRSPCAYPLRQPFAQGNSCMAWVAIV